MINDLSDDPTLYDNSNISTPSSSINDQKTSSVSENNQSIAIQVEKTSPENPTSKENNTYWWSLLPENLDGWHTSSWFGTFRPYSNSWIFHAQLGWMHATQGENNDLWLWNNNFGWLWTANGVFPHLFNHGSVIGSIF